jgi:hypothetical protein
MQDGLEMEKKIRFVKEENDLLKVQLQLKIDQYDRDVSERDSLIENQRDSYSKQR